MEKRNRYNAAMNAANDTSHQNDNHTYRHRIGIHHQDEKIETKKLHQVAKNKQHRLHQSKTLRGGRKAQAKKKCTPIRTHNKR